ncbi:MAG TPA: hypothetical protein VHF87_06815 [Methylomirabilota bacterium]|nr:hypothetical protein [Methylomirabilota bacterium]
MVGYVPGRCAASFPDGRRRSLAVVLQLAIALLTGAVPAAAQVVPSPIDELIAKAARQGTLRVIVEVKPVSPGPATADAIAQAQDDVLQELAGTGHRVLRRFTTIPFLGLEVTADALRRLGASARVGAIREDMVLRPQESPASP